MEVYHGRRSGWLMRAKNLSQKNKVKTGDGEKQARFVFTLHPLFFAFGLYYAMTGRIGVFAVCTLSALLHEFGHAHVATNVGFCVKALSLMPYGASVTADMEGISFKDEIAVLLAGPLTNLLVAVGCVASWWFFPTIYPFTELVFTTNLSLFLINLLPVGTLDGGRILTSVCGEFLSKKYAEIITKTLGIILTAFLFLCFIFNLATAKDITGVNF